MMITILVLVCLLLLFYYHYYDYRVYHYYCAKPGLKPGSKGISGLTPAEEQQDQLHRCRYRHFRVISKPLTSLGLSVCRV